LSRLFRKKKAPRDHSGLPQLEAQAGRHPDLDSLAPFLVSPRFGIIKELKPFDAESSQPPKPYLIQSVLANHSFAKGEDAFVGAFGKGLTMKAARESALGEGVERYSSLDYRVEEITYARRGDLDGPSLDPARLVLYRPDQYAQVGYVPYAQESLLGWTRGRSLGRDEMVFVPALAVSLGYNKMYRDENIFGGTSSGLAASGSLAGAVFSAALEVIERDAVLIGWANQLAGRRWDPATHPDGEFRRLVKSFSRRGIAVELFQMPTDVGVAVFLALGIAENGTELPAAVAGFGAHPDASTAALKAVLEVGQIRPALRTRLRSEELRTKMQDLRDDPRLVKRLEDHSLFYAHPESSAQLDFLRKTPITRAEWPVPAPPRNLSWLVEQLAGKGHELIYFDLTPHDMKRLGLYTARAIIPDFQPVDFGVHQLRLGGERIYRLPFELGLRPHKATPETLNANPHPIS